MAPSTTNIGPGSSCGARHIASDPTRVADLRIAIFSGNYNCVRDGANKTLNRLVAFLLDQGVAVRVYSPTVEHPPFEAAGDVVSVPSIPIPMRREYRLSLGLTAALRGDIKRFRPTHFHVAAPDRLGIQAQEFGRELGVPVIVSLHTRFETYLRFYRLGLLRPLIERRLRNFYLRGDVVLAPTQPIAQDLRARDWARQVRVWGRGVDGALFSPHRRSRRWRKAHGFHDRDTVLLFFGRLVREKGIDIFAATIEELSARRSRVRTLIIGDGPEREKMERRLPGAVFTGHLEGEKLARAVASADILINPSVTEAFGNVNLEAMAAGLAVVSADVPSARALIADHRSGRLVTPDDPAAYAEAAEQLIRAPSQMKQLAMAAVVASAAFSWNDVLGSVLDLYLSIY